MGSAGYPRIEDHGIIGDLHTVALVGLDGSIDFMCYPRFDSPSIFASLLDARQGGKFRIAPIFETAKRHQLYLPDTPILVTRFLSAEGVAEISDFMPVEDAGHAHAVVRRAKTVRGQVTFELVCEPRFDYGRVPMTARSGETGEVVFDSEGADAPSLRLRTGVPLRVVDGVASCQFTLKAGESMVFVLEDARSGAGLGGSPREYLAETFKKTVNYWRRWIGQSSYKGRWRETVNRSALTLKLLTSAPFGSMVAAPTFGIPEHLGGSRNWDYRYTWIRDSSFMIYALIRLGYTAEASAFMDWIEDRLSELKPDGSLQNLYGIDGRHDLPEKILTHLEGYRRSAPVRVGNAAVHQLQLDIYGELMDSIYLFNKFGSPISHDLWRNVVRMIDGVCGKWREKDEGIWEIRGGSREFLHSRLMCWVAVDRAIRLASSRSFPAPLGRWMGTRDEIYEDIHRNFWNDHLQRFVQYKGGTSVGASVLLMPLVKFVSPKDPRWLATLRAVESDLVDDSLVYRYRIGDSPLDGLEGHEGTFSMCSFWYVECLSRSGDIEKARFLFERMLGYANHVGLYAEELGPSGEHLGNFPQAFTHLALISAAYDIDRRLNAAGQRA